MTTSRDQSYYEIALTNSQVRWIFIGLLACVVVAFLGGVWVGRDAQGPTVATAEPQIISTGGEAGEAPLEKLEFFDREDTSEPPVAAQSARQTEEVAVEQPVIIEDLAGRSQPQQQAKKEAVAEAEQPPAREAEARQQPAAAAAVPGPASAGTLVIQVFSTADQAQAQQVLERLRSGGYPAQLSPVDVSGRPMYRVRIGPYESREEAMRVADRVRRDYKLDTWITR